MSGGARASDAAHHGCNEPRIDRVTQQRRLDFAWWKRTTSS
jgi:hypothetical protein